MQEEENRQHPSWRRSVALWHQGDRGTAYRAPTNVRFRGFSGHSSGLQLKLYRSRNGFCEIWPAIRGEKPGFG
jgi:hypothetical protein